MNKNICPKCGGEICDKDKICLDCGYSNTENLIDELEYKLEDR